MEPETAIVITESAETILILDETNNTIYRYRNEHLFDRGELLVRLNGREVVHSTHAMFGGHKRG